MITSKHIARFVEESHRPGFSELVNAITKALTDHGRTLLSKQDQTVCSKDFDEAYQKASFFETACGIVVNSGFNYLTLSKKEIEDLGIYVLEKQTK
jgi:hypothetical protein